MRRPANTSRASPRGGSIWITYPKGGGKQPGGIHRDIIREEGEKTGLTAVSIVAVDETWSALRMKVSAA